VTISTTMLQSDLDFMISDLPTSVTWNSGTYSCIVGDINNEDATEIAGIMENAGFVVVISLDDFSGSYPDSGDRVTIAGNNYRVASFVDSPDGISRTLNCVGDLQ
jgi:hypothetical protein